MLCVMNYLFPLAAIICNTQKKCEVLRKQSAKGFHIIFQVFFFFVCISTKFLGVHLLMLSQQLARYRNCYLW